MPQQLLTKGGRPVPNRPTLAVTEDMQLALGRVHEICGLARRTLATTIAARQDGPVIWIAPAWWPERINGDGLFHHLAPGRVLFVHPTRPEDLLWCMEESLRCGIIPTVICEMPRPPALTPVRRLHLAAETGAGMGKTRPLGILLTEGAGGAAGVESRWSLSPAHQSEAAQRWRLDRLRDRTAPPKSWTLHTNKRGMRTAPLDETPPTGTAPHGMPPKEPAL